jgi:hypothetical protein
MLCFCLIRSYFNFDTVRKTDMNHLEKIVPVAKIAKVSCTICVESLESNLLMHTDRCEMERLNCVRMYIKLCQNVGHPT